MKIHLTSVCVDDQRTALDFYTNVLGLDVHHEIPLGDVVMAVFDDTCGNLIQIVDRS